MKMIERPDKKSAALSRMQRICSVREYCKAEIRKKLQRYELLEGEVEQVIVSLEANNFIDERRYAAAFVRDKSYLCGWGNGKIIWALKSRGVDREIIDEAILQLSPDESIERLRKVLDVKYRTLSKEEPVKQKVKLLRFALSRGFGYDLAIQVADEIIKKDRL